MSNDFRQAVRRVFMEVVELPGAARSEALNAACGGDAALRSEVEALLAADEKATGFMSTLPTMVGHGAITDAMGEIPGSVIGPYRLVELLGEGGFGTVFRAEQTQPVAREVALKIIKLGMDTRQVIARFEAERQALVIMEHPNIARILDAGATERGRPYFVMDLVRGARISDYCDENNLGVRERLELFAEVCSAVQHAHTKGVIHRDIKPSNVLVTTLDGRPLPKIIDFGIAKATAARPTDKTNLTEERQLIGTPEYMSPEQAAGSADTDTRTDVYSLGVLLYELLTGATPFDTMRLRSVTFDEMRRIIREVDPPRPSTRISQIDTTAGLSGTRRADARKLNSLLRGELDWIVMKAIEKDRSRRYQTAAALADDVRRYLCGEAIVAAPPSASYRIGKFVRRHRVGAIAALAVSTALVVGVVAFAWQARVARRERDIARLEAARANATNTFVETMLLAADPQMGGSREVTVTQLLSRASASADRSLADQPIVEAHARALLGSTFRSLGKIDEATAELQRALELLKSAGETNSIFMAGTLRKLGLIQMDRRQPKEALPLFQQAQAIVLALGPERSGEAIRGYIDIAQAFDELGQFEECLLALDQAESILATQPDARSVDRAAILGVRSRLAKSRQNDLVLAQKLAEEQVTLLRQGEPSVVVAEALNGLAILRMEAGKHDEALKLYEEALVIARVELGHTHPRVALLLENCANIWFRRKDLEKAQSMLDQVLVIREEAFGAESMQATRTRFNIGAVSVERGDFARGLELVDAALPVFRSTSGNPSLDVAVAMRLRAVCLKGLGNLDGAIEQAASALAMFDLVTPATSPLRLRCIQSLAEMYCLKNLPDDAERILQKGLSALSPDQPEQAKWITTFDNVRIKCRETPKGQ